MKFEKIQPGMVLWDCHSQKMGNTTMSTLGTWSVFVVQVDSEKRRALVKWNGNPERWWYESQLAKLTKEQPILIREGMGHYRRPTREERAEILAKRKEQPQ
jgi:hypothetical protein